MSDFDPSARSATTGSSTNSRSRPVSRASTTSMNTTSDQTVDHHQLGFEPTNTASSHTLQASSGYDMTDNLVLQAGNHMINNHREYTLDPSLHEAHERGTGLGPGYPNPTNGARPALYPHRDSFQSRGNMSIPSVNEDQAPEDNNVIDPKKKKGSATSAANDLELKRLYQENKHRTLHDVAASVLHEERGPRSEKTKQIFAMIWLSTVCQKGTGSVPRNRVFSFYATGCGNQRVPPLNPASFGKLVRIIFPGIQTRRLGMRGESKYHYVDLEMIENEPRAHQERSALDACGNGINRVPLFQRQQSSMPADTAVFPPPTAALNAQLPATDLQTQQCAGDLLSMSSQLRMLEGPTMLTRIDRVLKFPSANANAPPDMDVEAMELPSLDEYMPPGTDLDAADALKALYRTHCIAVIDSFRFCKEKALYHSFTSFHGTLTVPVQKLLAHPTLAPWVRECDWLMYQKMIRQVAPLALQVMPVKVIDTFRAISTKLGQHILNTFQNHPSHLIDARYGPAKTFAGLINRLLRVNATAHAAANLLTDANNRSQMWIDWSHHVDVVNVVETALPSGCDHFGILIILIDHIRELLGPLETVYYDRMFAIYKGAIEKPYPPLPYLPDNQDEAESDGTKGVLDRWTMFLTWIPTRYPSVDARAIVYAVTHLGASAMNDLTMAQAPSFGCWHVTKTWVDEMILWLAEMGGFLDSSPKVRDTGSLKRSATSTGFDLEDDFTRQGRSRPRTGNNGASGSRSQFDGSNMNDRFAANGNNVHFQPPLDSNSHRSGIDSTLTLGQYTQPDPAHQRGSFIEPARPLHNGYNYAAATNPQYFTNSMIVQDGGYAGHDIPRPTMTRPAYSQGQTQRPFQAQNKPRPNAYKPSTPSPTLIGPDTTTMMQMRKPENQQESTEDSGLGQDIDPSPQPTPAKSMVDYGAFVGNNATASDPADEVVC